MKFIAKLIYLLLGSVLCMTFSVAGNYPTRSITLIVPYGPGGAADLSARMIAGAATAYLGQTVLAVNRSGASGVAGSSLVVNAKPDGYTFLLARVGSQMGVPAMNKTIPYRWDEFTMLGLIEINPFVLTVSAKSGIKTFAEFEAKIKNGEAMSYSSAGAGTLLHIATALMANAMGADFHRLTHVSYESGAKARAAVVEGQVDFAWQNLPAVISAIEAGHLSALAVTMPERVGAIAEVPTVAEVNYRDMEKIIGWSAIYGPPGLSAEVIDRWLETLQQLKTDRVWNRMTTGLGNIIAIRSPEDTRAFIEAQYKIFDRTLLELGLRID